MMYCKKCKILTDNDRCHHCGSRKIRVPLVNDELYLATLMSDYEIEQLLNKNGIPFFRKALGVNRMAKPRPPFVYYVPFGAYEQAKEILEIVESTHK